MTRKLLGTVRLPRAARSGLDTLSWAKDVNNALQQLRDRQAYFSPSKKSTSLGLRFWPEYQIVAGDPDTYTVTVTEGCVEDHDAIGIHGSPHAAENLLDESAYFDVPNQFDGDALAKFAIVDGQAVYVAVNVLSTGVVGIASGNPCQIVVGADDLVSTHHIPENGLPPVSPYPGVYYYKLAVFHVTAGIPSLEIFDGGNNIVHHRPRGLNVDMQMTLSTLIGTGYSDSNLTVVFSHRNGRLVWIGEYGQGSPPSDLIQAYHSGV